jgi:hypothetical protein
MTLTYTATVLQEKAAVASQASRDLGGIVHPQIVKHLQCTAERLYRAARHCMDVNLIETRHIPLRASVSGSEPRP